MKKKEPTITSVIVVTYGRADYLKNCIDSLLAQTVAPDEIIVVTRDDDTGTKKLLDKYSADIIKVLTVSKPGIIKAENKGLDKAAGDVVCFIDDDATADENWIAKIQENFKDDSIIGVGGPSLPVENGKAIHESADIVGKITWYGFVLDNFHKSLDKPRQVDHLRGCNMAFRAKLLSKFDERLLGDAYRFEMDACMQIGGNGRIIFNPSVLVIHYLAPRLSDPREIDATKLKNNIHNNTYVLLKNLPIFQKPVFLSYALLWGGHPYIPGVFYVIGRCVKHMSLKYLKQLPVILSANIGGAITYLSYVLRKK